MLFSVDTSNCIPALIAQNDDKYTCLLMLLNGDSFCEKASSHFLELHIRMNSFLNGTVHFHT